MRRSHEVWVAVLLLTFAGPCRAAVSLADIASSAEVMAPAARSEPEPPPVAEPTWLLHAIRFVGNQTTRERTLLRELPFKPGDVVTAAALELGRQAIQNLNLFKQVTLEQQAGAQGGVEVVYTVKERWYVLAYPRVDANADGQYAYGGQVDWNNVWGLNHTLRLSVLRKETQREGIGKEQNYSLGYAAPQVLDSRWSLGVGASYTERPVRNDFGQYDERLEAYQALVSRALDATEPNQGWSAGTGLLWTRQATNNGLGQYGEALGPVGVLGYRRIKLNIYSEEGLVFSSRLDAARQGLAADYDFARLSLNATRFLRVGATPHQTVHLFGDAAFNWDGPKSVRYFTLGGVGALRGYERGFREGNAYFRIGSEWARPVFRPWLRTVVIAEAGNVYAHPNDFDPSKLRTSIGFGIRIRVPTFVNVQLEAGVAFPLGGGGKRFFAGQV